MKKPAIYIIANKQFGTLYVGVTSDLLKRVFEHKNNIFCGFSSLYQCKMLVFYSFFETMTDAIVAEKKLKKGSRLKKINLIDSMNPEWNDLHISSDFSSKV